MRFTQTFAITATAAVLVCSSAYPRDEMLTVSSSGQNVSVTLTGAISYCDAQLGAFVGPPVSNVVGTNVNIQSTITGGECPPPPPGFVPPPPVPYSITVPLGNLADGTYSVRWSFVGGVPQNFTTSFTVAHGALVAVLPLSPLTLVVLALALAGVGIRVIRS